MKRVLGVSCIVLLLQLGPHPAICSPSLPSFVHPARVNALRSRTGRPCATDGCEHKTRLEATRAHRLVRFLRGIELPAFGDSRRLREMMYAANHRRPRDHIAQTIQNGFLGSRGIFMAWLGSALDDVGTSERGSPDPCVTVCMCVCRPHVHGRAPRPRARGHQGARRGLCISALPSLRGIGQGA